LDLLVPAFVIEFVNRVKTHIIFPAEIPDGFIDPVILLENFLGN
jgi:hypothetical protein